MLTILWREIRDRKTSLIAYCTVGIALVWLYVALFPSIQASSSQFEKLFQSYPKGFYQALGIQELSFNTVEKFLSIELFSFMWPILAILFALSRAGGTLAGEIERGTMGLYLSLPISRLKIYFSKYAGILLAIALFIVITIASILPITALYNTTASAAVILRLSLLSMLFMWTIYAMGMFFSALFSERSKVYMVAGGVILIMYAANVVASLKPGLRWIHKGSLFYYYNAQDTLSGGRPLRLSSLLVFIGSIVMFTALGAWLFSKRDITV